ncbi:hypothetical protein ACFSM5_14485 [Lacibacterium aquatile]|uniref:Uncharacterized protein n=1 Tax=Lacibacterium aquatile TaxID=1168082 RepID=A0ABW5DVW0_9PROT
MRFGLVAAFVVTLLAPPAFSKAFGELGPFAKLIDDRPLSEAERNYRGEANLTEEQRTKIRATLKDGAVKVRAFLDDPANKADLAKNANNMVYAMSVMGLEEIVEVLLAYPEVQASLNNPTIHGPSIWTMASLAFPHSSKLCGNKQAQSASIEVLGAYFGTDPANSPFPRIRQKLEAAGAAPKPQEASTIWSRLCASDPFYNITDETAHAARLRIADAPDVLPAILAEMETYRKLGHPAP